MESTIIEANYPLSFRKEEAKKLGNHLKSRHSVVLIGMKRVGISNFLRFFLNHKDIVPLYIKDYKDHLFIPVDLNDLVEREIYPFWTLTLKRIADAVNKSSQDASLKKDIELLFLDSIQSGDLFLTIDSVRRALVKLCENKILPTIFFIRFDRMKDAASLSFFSNLQGLKDATHRKLTYVFTSYRSLDSLSPEVFKKASLSVFSKDLYVKPAKREDIKIIAQTYKKRYGLKFLRETEKALFEMVDGYIQYLQLSLISLSEKPLKRGVSLFGHLIKDERIGLQSDELWESLTKEEQGVLLKIAKEERVSEEEKKQAEYLWNTGFVSEIGERETIFSPLFAFYIKSKVGVEIQEEKNSSVEFTKKENVLFNLLKNSKDEICEREKIIETVWPEVEELGVSDWAIDRLMSRVRGKLRLKKSQFEIQTIKTRGYKLVEAA